MKRRLWIVALVAVGGLLFFFVGPAQAGGPASYIVINGNSMEPGYHRGDLVIVRERADYQEGDIVAYRHPELGIVIHRVIGREGSRFVMQGDNNDFIDGHRPEPAEMVGSPVVHIPSVGKHLMKRRVAIVFASVLLLSLSVFGLLRADTVSGKLRRRRRRRSRTWQGTEAGGSEGAEWKP